ncbi:YpiF family protein [Ectobacillus ponti]|uniref:YpiF family protein n=1 Tax=Ectobacillus ponti TaxID=2961894 RepID=A0AA41X8D2_9BACI|nr:YpiF family protein [Ectobacillus ponti]MCP8968765.1 YpiF family protein [Ectobacillus ponti]
MDWIVKDIQLYEQAREYVDTAVVPLIPVSLGADVQSIVQKGEYISVLTRELEHEYRGRLLRLPEFSYMTVHAEAEQQRLRDWTDHLLESGMRHVVYVTSDYSWKEADLPKGTLFWLPALPIEQLDSKAKREVIHSQIREMMTILTKKWEKTE